MLSHVPVDVTQIWLIANKIKQWWYLLDDFHVVSSPNLSLEVKQGPHHILQINMKRWSTIHLSSKTCVFFSKTWPVTYPTLGKATLIGVSVHFKLNGFPWFRNAQPLFFHTTLCPSQGNGMAPTHYGVIDCVQRSCWPFIVKLHKTRLPNLVRNQELTGVRTVRFDKGQRQLRNETNKLLFQTSGALTFGNCSACPNLHEQVKS